MTAPAVHPVHRPQPVINRLPSLNAITPVQPERLATILRRLPSQYHPDYVDVSERTAMMAVVRNAYADVPARMVSNLWCAGLQDLLELRFWCSADAPLRTRQLPLPGVNITDSLLVEGRMRARLAIVAGGMVLISCVYGNNQTCYSLSCELGILVDDAMQCFRDVEITDASDHGLIAAMFETFQDVLVTIFNVLGFDHYRESTNHWARAGDEEAIARVLRKQEVMEACEVRRECRSARRARWAERWGKLRQTFAD